jgi:hypothetical protein
MVGFFLTCIQLMYHICIIIFIFTRYFTQYSYEDERMKPEKWIPLGWLPIIDKTKSRRPTQGYEGDAARNCRLFHECWKHFLSNWKTFSSSHRLVIMIYADGIARETMHFIAGLLGDQQVYLIMWDDEHPLGRPGF